MRFVEINYFQTLLCKSDCAIRQNVFNRRKYIADGLYLNGFDGEHIVFFVHFYLAKMAI
jgi:hypothetical protein